MRHFVIFLLCLSPVCLGQEQTAYHNSEWNFSLVLPEGWEQIPVDELPRTHQEMLKNDFRSKTVTLCQKAGAEYFTTPYILVQAKSSEEVSENVIEKLAIGNKDKTLKVLEMNIERLQKGTHFGMLKSWKGAKQVETEVKYDKGRHISFERAKLHHNSLGEIIIVVAKFLGSHRMVSLQCFADGDNAENFLSLVNQVIDSFMYDKGYGFGETKGATSSLIHKFFGNTWQSWLLWAVGIIIVSWLIRRWVTS